MYFCIMCNPAGVWKEYPFILWFSKKNLPPMNSRAGNNGEWHVVTYAHRHHGMRDGGHLKRGDDYD